VNPQARKGASERKTMFKRKKNLLKRGKKYYVRKRKSLFQKNWASLSLKDREFFFCGNKEICFQKNWVLISLKKKECTFVRERECRNPSFGLAIKARLAEVQAKSEARESHFMF